MNTSGVEQPKCVQGSVKLPASVAARTRVSPRMDARRVVAKGLFPGAVVVRGCDWRWNDQDGK